MLPNKKVLITAGPTFEPIDPVRYIGNRSSGKMGLALVHAFLEKGYIVTLILGPIHLEVRQHQNLTVVHIETAAQLYSACEKYFDWYDIGVFAAAVADYTPSIVSSTKIKKQEDHFVIEMMKTKDILFEAGKRKKEYQFLVGFALETNDEISNAKAKLIKKNLDMIVLNSLNDSGAGFKFDTNKISILDKDDKLIKFELKSKEEVAKDIFLKIEAELNDRN